MHKKTLLALPLLIAASSPALAHVGHAPVSGFAAGLAHPVLGLDHLLAMVAVGLWAAMAGGRAIWAWPLAFVGAMLAGAAMAMGGLALPLVEPAILASVIVLGAALGVALRPGVAAGAGVGVLFGLFHGHAHGAELPLQAGAAGYVAGFALATVTLHAVGIAAGRLAPRLAGSPLAPRALGWAVAAAGVVLLAA